jgi:ElaB/YqjD/DUF883 family membrane-anchored ribosome-binding protein
MNAKASDYAEQAKSRVSETLQNVQEKVGDKAKAATEATDRYVRENPWRMVAVVAIAACAFGYLLGTLRD